MSKDYSQEIPIYHEKVPKTTDYGDYLIYMTTYGDGASFITIYDNRKRGILSKLLDKRLLMVRKIRRFSDWGETLKRMLFELEYDQYQMDMIESDDSHIYIDYEHEAKKRRSKASHESPAKEEPTTNVPNQPEEIKFFSVTDWQTRELTHVPANEAAKVYLQLGGEPEEADDYVILNGKIRNKQQIGNLKQFQNII